MAIEYPFHYEIISKFFAFDAENNFRTESFTTVFGNKDPLTNRQEAFKEFEEYLSFLDQNDRIILNERGNYVISQPSFISEVAGMKDKDEGTSIEKFFSHQEKIDQYRESLSIYLVINDTLLASGVIDVHNVNDTINLSENEDSVPQEEMKTGFPIHVVSSNPIDEQELVDNLEFYELTLYNHYKIDVSSHAETVYHYDYDYAESGEADDGAERTILKTPFQWKTLEIYQIEFTANNENDHAVTDQFDYRRIISRGESNTVEFRPSLSFNFNNSTWQGKLDIKYKNAKAICAFLNSNGGLFLVGISDLGLISGLNGDYSILKGENKKDGLLLELDSLLATFFSLSVKPLIEASIVKMDNQDILAIYVSPSKTPVFLKNRKQDEILKEFYIRMNASTHQIKDTEEIVEYIINRTN